MLIIMQFTFQIVLLAVGFGVGYLLLISANTQETPIKTIGQTLGGILIVMAMVLAIFSCYYSMKILNKGYMQGGCPMQNMGQPQERPILDNQENSSDEEPQKNENNSMSYQNEHGSTDVTPDLGEQRPIKSDIKDHE